MTDNSYNFTNGTHFILKKYYTTEFINELYTQLFTTYSAKNADAFMNYHQLNHAIKGNYNYTINSENTDTFDNFQTILDNFNTLIRNALIENNNKYITRTFSIQLADIQLCITRKNTPPTNIVKSRSINIFIPLHSFPNGGTVSIFPNKLQDNTDTNDIIDKYYNVDEINKKLNYGDLSNYSDEDKEKFINEEVFIDTEPGDVLIVNKNTFSRSIPNFSDQDRYCLQLIYNVNI